MRTVGGVVNTAIIMAAAEGIIAARDRSLLVRHGGHIKIKKSWGEFLLGRMAMSRENVSMQERYLFPILRRFRKTFLLTSRPR